MPDRIVATFPAALTVEADDTGERRIVAGIAVPYGEVGRTNIGPVRFLPGSLEPDASIPATRDHDPGRLVGRVVAHHPGEATMTARVRLSGTPLGDETLILADDGTIGGFSVDADPIEFAYVNDPVHGRVMNVARAAWTGLALVPRPAFEGARIATVAAADHVEESEHDDDDDDDDPDAEVDPGDADPDDPEAARDPDNPDDPDDDDDEDPDDQEGSRMPTTTTAPPPIAAAATGPAVIPTTATAPAAPPFTLSRLAAAIAAAQGDAPAIRAALTNVTTTSFAGLMRPQYVDDLTGIISVGRPAVEAFGRRNLTGNPIMHPHWKTLGLVDVQVDQKTQVASGPAEIEWKTLNAVTYAGANDLAIQVVDWGTPSAIESYIRMMAEVYGRKTEAAMETALIAAATDVAGDPADVMGSLGGAIGMVAGTGLPPDLILSSGDVYGLLWTTLAAAGPGLFSAVNAGFPTPRVVLLPFAPAGTLIVGSSQAAVTYEKADAPVEVRAVDVSLLGIDLGVYGYFVPVVDYPAALVQLTGTVVPFAAPTRAK